MKPRCSAALSEMVGDCMRPATVERSGRHYCWQHDPERHKAEQQKRREASRTRELALDAEWRRKRLVKDSGIADLTNEELEKIIACGGIRSLIP